MRTLFLTSGIALVLAACSEDSAITPSNVLDTGIVIVDTGFPDTGFVPVGVVVPVDGDALDDVPAP